MQAFLIALIVLVGLGGGYFWYSQQPKNPSPMETSTDSLIPSSDGSTDMDHAAPGGAVTPATPMGTSATPAAVASAVKEFSFTNKGFAFNPSSFTVKKGDHVRVTFTNGGGTHDFRIDGYDVGTNVIQGGKSQTFEFVADKAGTFEFFCSVGNHRAMGMRGVLTVTP